VRELHEQAIHLALQYEAGHDHAHGRFASRVMAYHQLRMIVPAWFVPIGRVGKDWGQIRL
jgi:hypothetical protein